VSVGNKWTWVQGRPKGLKRGFLKSTTNHRPEESKGSNYQRPREKKNSWKGKKRGGGRENGFRLRPNPEKEREWSQNVKLTGKKKNVPPK